MTTHRRPRSGSAARRLRGPVIPVLAALAAAVAGLLAAACERVAGSGVNAGRPDVVATTGMIGDAARIIAGDRVSVAWLMGQGVDPHLYKAAPGDMRLMSQARLVLYNGLHLEGRLADALLKLAEKQPVVAAADAIPRDRLRNPPEFKGHPDPHVWFDVGIWMHAVERIRDAMIEVDAAGAPVYTANAARYLDELRVLDGWVSAEIGRIPEGMRVLVTAHDAFGYFGRAYGMEVMAIQGISTDSEASIRDINGLVDTLVARRIPAVFIESSVPRKTIDALVEGCAARGHRIAVGGELFSDAMGKDGTPEGTYVGMVRHNVRTIVAALAGPGAARAREERGKRETGGGAADGAEIGGS